MTLDGGRMELTRKRGSRLKMLPVGGTVRKAKGAERIENCWRAGQGKKNSQTKNRNLGFAVTGTGVRRCSVEKGRGGEAVD